VLRENARSALLLSFISLPHRSQLRSVQFYLLGIVPFYFVNKYERAIMTIKSKDCSQFASLSFRVHFFLFSRFFFMRFTRFRSSCRYMLPHNILPGFFSPVLRIMRINQSLIFYNYNSSLSNIVQIIRSIALTSFHQFTGLSISRLTLVTQLSIVPAMTRMYRNLRYNCVRGNFAC